MKDIALVKIEEIKPNPDNPRLIKDDNYKKLVQSIKESPWMLYIRPIIVNADKMVLGGNMRLKACQDAKLKEIPVLVADNLTDAQQQEFIIKDNLGYGEWDFDKLASDWDHDKLNAWGVDCPWDLKPKTEADDYQLADETQYTLIINCNNEHEQKSLYEELEKRGFACKLMM